MNSDDAALSTSALTRAVEALLSRKDSGEGDAMKRAARLLAEDYDWPDFSPVLEA